jgi:hypothetical protein
LTKERKVFIEKRTLFSFGWLGNWPRSEKQMAGIFDDLPLGVISLLAIVTSSE